MLINPYSDLRVDSTSENNPGGKKEEEVVKQEPNSSPSHTSSDQPRPSTPASRVAVFKEQRCGGESSEHNMEGVQDAQQEPTGVYMSHDNGKEPATWCPAKKKRRMGMCGLTEKERSHFLQTQKRENGQNGTVGNERHKSDKVGEEEMTCSASLSSPPSIAAVSVTEQIETDLKLQSGYCEVEDRAETDVHIAMTTSDGTRNGGDPAGSSEGHTCQADPSNVPHPAQVSDSELDPPAEDGEHLGVSHALVGEEQQEQGGSTVETAVKKDETQTKDGDDGSGMLDRDPGSTFPTNTSQNEGSEREQRDGSQASAGQMDSVVRRTNGRVEGTGGEAWDGDGDEAMASTRATKPGVLSCGSVDVCSATVSPSGSAGEGNCGPKDTHGTGPAPGNTERPQTRLTPDPFGSGSLDYVSDSQLNSIVLIDDMMEHDWDLSSSDCCEDATDLVCGLIRELSSLNRTVMATHRELENLRRGNKVSRTSTL
ncbi:uncharacterized protein LOC115367382 isoform X2 [Myripristis murdjan]|nr:uncharacterized protein LOC115367382 isoform X2 [Myripristis murdjan]XP_029919280.1 uncharacterized protein LOC115367382 isoform X2 [Myripristis murdjan]XP_029919356.1 uncharacterized protein LOC115367382 isoform X2 [Myripristis murdjan]